MLLTVMCAYKALQCRLRSIVTVRVHLDVTLTDRFSFSTQRQLECVSQLSPNCTARITYNCCSSVASLTAFPTLTTTITNDVTPPVTVTVLANPKP